MRELSGMLSAFITNETWEHSQFTTCFQKLARYNFPWIHEMVVALIFPQYGKYLLGSDSSVDGTSALAWSLCCPFETDYVRPFCRAIKWTRHMNLVVHFSVLFAWFMPTFALKQLFPAKQEHKCENRTRTESAIWFVIKNISSISSFCTIYVLMLFLPILFNLKSKKFQYHKIDFSYEAQSRGAAALQKFSSYVRSWTEWRYM